MSIARRILLLRLSYWISALADFAIAYLALIPERMGLENIAYPMGLTSVIAFSWGILLLMADRKPMERRWILIPTIIVVSLLTVARVIFSEIGVVDFHPGLFAFGAGLALFMSYSYYISGRGETG